MRKGRMRSQVTNRINNNNKACARGKTRTRMLITHKYSLDDRQ